MAANEKKVRERAIFELVYSTRPVVETIASERPDFLVRCGRDEHFFGVEVAEFFESTTEARLQRIPDYVGDLLDGRPFKHKDDRRVLEVGKVDILTEKHEVHARGVPAIVRTAPPFQTYVQRVADIVKNKNDKMREAMGRLAHVNLIIRDHTHFLHLVPRKMLFPLFFVDELKQAIAGSSFREVYFVTDVDKELGVVRLNLLHLLSEVFFFSAVFDRVRFGCSMPPDTDDLEVFASYFQSCVKGPVFVLKEANGYEVIYGDAGLYVEADSLSVRLHQDFPLPSDATPAASDLAKALGDQFHKDMREFRQHNTFETEVWFPIEATPAAGGESTDVAGAD